MRCEVANFLKDIFYVIAQKNDFFEHICNLLLKKTIFLSNGRFICLKKRNFEAILMRGII